MRTGTGLRTADVLFALHLRTGRLVLAEATWYPRSSWSPYGARLFGGSNRSRAGDLFVADHAATADGAQPADGV